MIVHSQNLEASNNKLTTQNKTIENKLATQEIKRIQLESTNYALRVRLDSFVKESTNFITQINQSSSNLKSTSFELDQSKSSLFSKTLKKESKSNVFSSILDDTARLSLAIQDLVDSQKTLKSSDIEKYKVMSDETKATIKRKAEHAAKGLLVLEQMVDDVKDKTELVKLSLDKAVLVQTSIFELMDIHQALRAQLDLAEIKISADGQEIVVLNTLVESVREEMEGAKKKELIEESRHLEIAAKLQILERELDPKKTKAALHIKNKKDYLEDINQRGITDNKKLIMLFTESVQELESVYNILIGISSFKKNEKTNILGVSFVGIKENLKRDDYASEFESSFLFCKTKVSMDYARIQGLSLKDKECNALVRQLKNEVEETFEHTDKLMAKYKESTLNEIRNEKEITQDLDKQINFLRERLNRTERQNLVKSFETSSDQVKDVNNLKDLPLDLDTKNDVMIGLKRVQTKKELIKLGKKSMNETHEPMPDKISRVQTLQIIKDALL